MGTAVIRVKDEIYCKLYYMKKPKESFGAVIERLIKIKEEYERRMEDE